MEKLICPQCGGNDFQLFGSSAYKCESCGTILKDEAKETPPPKTHYVAPLSTDYDTDFRRSSDQADAQDFGSTKTVLGIVFVALAALVLLLLKSCPGSNEKVIVDIPSINVDSIIKEQFSKMPQVPDHKAKPSYSENGITVSDVEIRKDESKTDEKFLSTYDQLQLSLLKPKGFKRKGANVFIGMALTVKDNAGKVVYSVDDLNKTAGLAGEDYHRYQKSLDISFIISNSFGFEKPGNYVIEYRVWDKNSKNEISGIMPVFIFN